ncbi:Alpha/Beta hydrolase protein [Exophiala viscosa]|uniref:Alpha/Beta hydrolase protein n=1 Tax=Exophiala viscosa TaxID=2486360 RepID=A0AAN6DTP9_9EURO|nr:Alpha/Beta hydrolase protein [Exophiala viscosa]KAI1623114.1 Alpha/Beta hydrolase protein [Exophiala viscosa]
MVSGQLPIRVDDHCPITLPDGTVLSAQIWRPDDASASPVPAILEYLPYRKRDYTAPRDALNHPYVAAHGYACVRVDMRGSGDSEGVLLGEYLKQEQDDALAILQWIAAQDWCTGSIGMIGISWGGFNGLQVAARRPPELKAVISICSTDDRYADDIHYMGGCLLVDNFLWGATMFSMNPLPPDPVLVGEKWRDLWLARLEAGGLYMVDWHRHQRRDAFWKHASICENYDAIQCPVYLVGGWMDPYTNTIFRNLQNLTCPKKGLVGPWAHKYPNFAEPGPPIGFLQESVRWWDKWLKGKETGIMDEPTLRCYMQDTAPPQTHYDFRPGHWVAESGWPSQGVASHGMGLAPGRLTNEVSTSSDHLAFCSPQTVGFASGRWCIFGLDADEPADQRQEVGGSLVFDSHTFADPMDLLGPVSLQLRVASDKPNAVLAAVLSEVLPDGSATRISWGLLNLTHRNSHADLEPLEPGRYYDVTVKLNDLGQRIGVGSRIRLALSTSYFPTIWPAPEASRLTLDCAHCKLDLPMRSENPLDSQLKPFQPAVNGSPLKTHVIRPARSSNKVSQDLNSGVVTILLEEDAGLWENERTGWRYGSDQTIICSVHPDDPLSARAEQRFRKEFGRDELDLAVAGWAKMSATRTDFELTAHLEAWEGKKQIFGKDYAFTIPRDCV